MTNDLTTLQFNPVLRSTAVRYARIMDCLKKANGPLTEFEIYETASVKETCKGPYNVKDALKAMNRDKVVRRVPVAGVGRARYGFELVDSAKKEVDRALACVNEKQTSMLDDQLPTIRALLNYEEYIGFMKGCLIVYPERRDDFLKWIEEHRS